MKFYLYRFAGVKDKLNINSNIFLIKHAELPKANNNILLFE